MNIDATFGSSVGRYPQVCKVTNTEIREAIALTPESKFLGVTKGVPSRTEANLEVGIYALDVFYGAQGVIDMLRLPPVEGLNRIAKVEGEPLPLPLKPVPAPPFTISLARGYKVAALPWMLDPGFIEVKPGLAWGIGLVVWSNHSQSQAKLNYFQDLGDPKGALYCQITLSRGLNVIDFSKVFF